MFNWLAWMLVESNTWQREKLCWKVERIFSPLFWLDVFQLRRIAKETILLIEMEGKDLHSATLSIIWCLEWMGIPAQETTNLDSWAHFYLTGLLTLKDYLRRFLIFFELVSSLYHKNLLKNKLKEVSLSLIFFWKMKKSYKNFHFEYIFLIMKYINFVILLSANILAPVIHRL